MSFQKLKDPVAVVDYTFNWDDGYLDSTSSPVETISTSTWSISPADSPGLTVDSSSKTATTATAFFTGGVVGMVYQATNKIVTTGGRTDERSLTIRVEER